MIFIGDCENHRFLVEYFNYLTRIASCRPGVFLCSPQCWCGPVSAPGALLPHRSSASRWDHARYVPHYILLFIIFFHNSAYTSFHFHMDIIHLDKSFFLMNMEEKDVSHFHYVHSDPRFLYIVQASEYSPQPF